MGKGGELQWSHNARTLLLIFSLVSSILSHAASWDEYGSYDLSWYSASETTLDISTPEELAGVAYLVNNNFTSFSGTTINITADIDLSGRTWIPIGTSNTDFAGTFEGNGHTISGIIITSYGFWVHLSGVNISNTTFIGSINGTNSYMGFVACDAENCEFENIICESTITCSREKLSVSSAYLFYFYTGGLVSTSTNCSFTNIHTTQGINFSLGDSNGNNCFGAIYLYAGGISGKSEDDSFEFCHTVNDFNIGINGYVTSSSYTSVGSSGIYVGGIAGYTTERTTFNSCLAENNSFVGNHYNGTYDSMGFIYGGIVGRFGIYYNNSTSVNVLKNCVAINKEYSVTGHNYSSVAAWYHTSSYFGGILYNTVPENYGGCYSNNDIDKTVSKVQLDLTGENGSTSFSTSQMHTQSFVDELNLYCQLEYGTERWTLNEEGKLSLKSSDTDTGIKSVSTSEKDNAIIGFYDMNGLRVSGLKKGINIIKYSNGRAKKVFLK